VHLWCEELKVGLGVKTQGLAAAEDLKYGPGQSLLGHLEGQVLHGEQVVCRGCGPLLRGDLHVLQVGPEKTVRVPKGHESFVSDKCFCLEAKPDPVKHDIGLVVIRPAGEIVRERSLLQTRISLEDDGVYFTVYAIRLLEQRNLKSNTEEKESAKGKERKKRKKNHLSLQSFPVTEQFLQPPAGATSIFTVHFYSVSDDLQAFTRDQTEKHRRKKKRFRKSTYSGRKLQKICNVPHDLGVLQHQVRRVREGF